MTSTTLIRWDNMPVPSQDSLDQHTSGLHTVFVICKQTNYGVRVPTYIEIFYENYHVYIIDFNMHDILHISVLLSYEERDN
jgi:hypothetical protein